MKTIAAALNAKYIHTSLAIRYLKAFCEPDYHVELAEYTINDPVLNIVSDLYQKERTSSVFRCYIWNIKRRSM